eukprot:CAMPEP_0204527382 /NCGR_PEP_ID=MMETSP0661-20131031/8952_1 /ASSEMBLY_ACC=CAM_ASM_000606 /TAXON_ID=109239 /ORGANISM="Alexandrium margalefi, Strain AMGDE01CS-322" /LENGTH=149 /DNA_ID=CAMNT_0051533285 /DNA_START=113 /DNA_END=558 /DNA_ORIENTATION=-
MRAWSGKRMNQWHHHRHIRSAFHGWALDGMRAAPAADSPPGAKTRISAPRPPHAVDPLSQRASPSAGRPGMPRGRQARRPGLPRHARGAAALHAGLHAGPVTAAGQTPPTAGLSGGVLVRRERERELDVVPGMRGRTAAPPEQRAGGRR